MSYQPASERSGILWSHNKRKYPYWLNDLLARAEAIKSQGFMWWDVGWKIDFSQFVFPMVGYIWNTIEKKATHKTLIERESKTLRQPQKQLPKEVNDNLQKLKIYAHDKSPLLEYLRGEREILTLLKLVDLEEMDSPLRLENFKLWDGTPILQPPQGYYRIQLS